MKIYSLKDRLTVHIGELVFKLAPLSFKQKSEVQALMANKKELEGVRLVVKYAVKDIEGVETLEGKKYVLEMDESGLTENCLDDLLNLENSAEISLACASLINGIPKEIVDPETGKAIEGIKIVNPTLAATPN